MKIIKLHEMEGMAFPVGRTTKALTGQNLLPTRDFTAGYVVGKPNVLYKDSMVWDICL